MAKPYNYLHFELDDEEMAVFDDFKTLHSVGDRAPTGSLVDAQTGETVQLEALWKRQHVLMEFGSFT